MNIGDLKTTATDRLDDRLHSVKRIVKQRSHDLEDLRDGATLRIRRSPFQTVGIAVGSGLVLGFLAGFSRGRRRASRVPKG